MSFVVEKLTVDRGFLSLLQFSPVIIVAGMFRTLLLYLTTALVRRTNGPSLGTNERSSGLSGIGENWTEKRFYYIMLKQVPFGVSVRGTNFLSPCVCVGF